jgi:hypothetical protein
MCAFVCTACRLEFVQKRWASLSNNPEALTQLRVVPFSPSVLARQRSTEEWGQLNLKALLATWQYLDQLDQEATFPTFYRTTKGACLCVGVRRSCRCVVHFTRNLMRSSPP